MKNNIFPYWIVGVFCSFAISTAAQTPIQKSLDSVEYFISQEAFLPAYLYCNKALQALKALPETDNLTLQYETYRQYLQVLKQVIERIGSPDAKRLFYEAEYQSYEKTIDLATQLFQQTGDKKYVHEAFELIERHRNVLLVQTLRGVQNGNFAGVPDSVLAEEGRLMLKIKQLEGVLERLKKGHPDTQQNIPSLENERDNATEAYRIFQKKIERQYANYFTNTQAQNEVNIPLLQAHLTKQAGFIAFFYGDAAVYAFVVTKANSHLLRLAPTSAVQAQILLFKNSLQDHEMRLVKTSTALYAQLFQPLKKHLPSVAKLSIVADGALAYLPFESLIERMPTDWDYDFSRLPYLIKTYQIAYQHSAAAFIYKKKAATPISKTPKILLLAPLFSTDLKNKFRQENKVDSIYETLAPLSQSEKLLAQIRQFFEVQPLLGEAADFSNFKKNDRCAVLHFATHTLLNEDAPLHSKIALAKNETIAHPSENGYLYLQDLYALSLSPELVVLGSCETGSGAYKRGEGVVSLAYGFKLAGAESTVYSLWKVDERATTALMADFYRFLKKGLPKDEALHRAKLAFLENATEITSSPFYWSGFVFNGEPSPLSFAPKPLGFFWLLISGFGVLILLGIVGQIYRNRKKNEKNTSIRQLKAT